MYEAYNAYNTNEVVFCFGECRPADNLNYNYLNFLKKNNSDYQFRIDEVINKCKRLQESFSDKSEFRTYQGFPD